MSKGWYFSYIYRKLVNSKYKIEIGESNSRIKFKKVEDNKLEKMLTLKSFSK